MAKRGCKPGTPNPHKWVYTSEQWIRARKLFNNNVSLEEVAKELNMSHATLRTRSTAEGWDKHRTSLKTKPLRKAIMDRKKGILKREYKPGKLRARATDGEIDGILEYIEPLIIDEVLNDVETLSKTACLAQAALKKLYEIMSYIGGLKAHNLEGHMIVNDSLAKLGHTLAKFLDIYKGARFLGDYNATYAEKKAIVSQAELEEMLNLLPDTDENKQKIKELLEV